MATEISNDKSKPAFVIYINGWPGVGKLAVAKALELRIAGSRIIHNHELIDPVEAKFSRSSSEYVHQRTIYRRARLAEIAEHPETVYIFTDSQTEYNACMNDYVQFAYAPHCRRFFSVVLQCELDENIRRLTSVGRGKHTKLTDPVVLRGFRESMKIYEFGIDDELVFDVTNSPAEETAAGIANFIELRETTDKRALPFNRQLDAQVESWVSRTHALREDPSFRSIRPSTTRHSSSDSDTQKTVQKISYMPPREVIEDRSFWLART